LKDQAQRSTERGLAVMQTAKQKVTDLAADLYVPGDQNPRLRTVLLAAGEYRLKATNEIVRTVEDLKGDIVDKHDNLIISAKELPLLCYYDQAKSKFVDLVDVGVASVKNAIIDMPATRQKLGNAAKEATTNLAAQMGIIDPRDPVDVKIDGEENPVITAQDMREGNCIDVDSGNEIRSQMDISGEVRNKKGELLVRREDLPKLRFFNWRIAKWSPLWIAGKLLKAAWHFQTRVAPGMAKRNLQRLWSAYKFVGSALWHTGLTILGVRVNKTPQDLYVKGQTNPVMYGKLMKEEPPYYFNVNGGKAIRMPADVNGAVKDRNGQIVLTDEEFSQGLYNIEGRKVSVGMLTRILKAAMAFPFKVAGAILKPFRSAAGAVIRNSPKMAMAGLSGLGRAASGVVGGLWKGARYAAGVRYEGSEAERAEMKEQRMRALGEGHGSFNGPMPEVEGPPKPSGEDMTARKTKNLTVRGMVDKIKGNVGTVKKRFGISREEDERLEEIGALESIKDTLKEEHDDKEKSKVATNSAADKEAHRKKTEGGLKGAAAAAGGGKKGEDGKDGGGSILDSLAHLKELLGGGGKAIGGAAKGLGRAGSWLGRLLGLGAAAEGAAGLAGAGTAAAAGAEGAALAGGAAAAAEGAAVAGGTAAAAAGGGGLLAGAAAVGGSILAFLTSPIVIGVAAVALAGYGVYRGVKYLRRGNLSPLGKLRCVQYGFKADDTAHAKAIVDLESDATKYIKPGPGGVPILDEKSWPLLDRMKLFDLSVRDPQQRKIFLTWYHDRFKRVFLTHMAAIKGLADKFDLGEAEDLKPEQKKRYIDAVAFPSGPYDVKTLPVMPPGALEATTADDVKVAVQEAYDDLTNTKRSSASQIATKVVGAAVGAGTAEAATLDGQARLGANTPTMPDQKAARQALTATSVIGVNALSNGKQVDALDAVRYKTYGLVELNPTRVQSLKVLEQAVELNLSFNRMGQAAWDGDVDSILNTIGPVFGMDFNRTLYRSLWSAWFQGRFLPTYLTYASAFKSRTGKETPSMGNSAIRPSELYEIAKLIVGTKGVWSVSVSPWSPEEKLNTNQDVVKDNLNFLKDIAAKVVLDEQKKGDSAATKPPAATPTAPATSVAKAAAQAAATTPVINREVAAPDAESKGSVTGGTPAPIFAGGAAGVGTLSLASGDMMDGRNAQAFVKLGAKVNLDGINPQMKTQLMGLIEEYGTLTGNSTTIRDGFRSYDDQVAMKKKYGARAAAPGTSLHEYGLAVDIDAKTLDDMDKLGLLRKYGFVRPVGQEPWHLEPIGTQDNLSLYKTDQAAATQAILAGAGKGGGGWGIDRSAKAYSRNRDLSMSILGATVPEKDPASLAGAAGAAKATGTLPGAPTGQVAGFAPRTASSGYVTQPAVIPVAGGSQPNTTTLGAAAGNAASGGAFTKAGKTLIGSTDSEMTPGTGGGAPIKSVQNDPTFKVPDPQGSGFSGLRPTIEGAAKLVGMDGNVLLTAAAMESDFNPNARAKGSSAEGLMGFTQGTWAETMGKYGKLYGYSAATTPPTDAKAAAIMAAHYFKDNLAKLQKSTSKPLTAADAYLTHFMGPGGADKFLSALEKTPDANASQLFPQAAAANPAIFTDGGAALSVAQVYAKISKRVQDKAKAYGLNIGSVDATMTPPPAPVTAKLGGSTGPLPATTVAPNDPTNLPTQAKTIKSVEFPKPPSAVTPGQSYAGAQSAPVAQPGASAMSGSMMKGTEQILGKSLEVQTQILKVLSQLADKAAASAANDAPPTSTAQPTSTYTPPQPAVSMRRQRYT
jgi:hypothetical protein